MRRLVRFGLSVIYKERVTVCFFFLFSLRKLSVEKNTKDFASSQVYAIAHVLERR